MKRTMLMLFILLFAFCSCTSKTYEIYADQAKGFNSNDLSNSFDNLLSGGNITYFNNSLYVVYNKDGVFNYGIYQINDLGNKRLITNNIEVNLTAETPHIFQYKDNLYTIDFSLHSIKKYDSDKNRFVESEFDIKPYSNVIYVSDDLLVWESDVNQISYIYRNGDIKKIDNAYCYYVYKTTIYYQDYYGYLLMVDCANSNKSNVTVCKLEQEYCGNKMVICNDFCYYVSDNADMDNIPSGLYRYSLKRKKNELVSSNLMCSIIPYKNKLYASDGESIFVDDGTSFSKFSDIHAAELYIVDEEWLYTNNNDGDIFRISLEDPQKVERIDVL